MRRVTGFSSYSLLVIGHGIEASGVRFQVSDDGRQMSEDRCQMTRLRLTASPRHAEDRGKGQVGKKPRRWEDEKSYWVE